MGLTAGAVSGEACGGQVRDLGGLRGAQRVLQVGMVPVDQDLRRGRALTGKNVKEEERKLLSNFPKGPLSCGAGIEANRFDCRILVRKISIYM